MEHLRLIIFFLSLALLLSACAEKAETAITGVGEGSIHITDISTSDDTGEETLSGGSVSISSSDLEIVTDASEQIVAVRFQNVQIPQGKQIDSAYVELTVDATRYTAGTVRVYLHDVDNSWPLAASTNNLSGRTKTSAYSSWTFPGTGNVGDKHNTSDLASVVEEVVQRAGWVNGNNMTFLFTDDPQGSASGAVREYESQAANNYFGLYVSYSDPSAGDSCTYSSGDHTYECSDNCVLTGDVNIDNGSSITINGSGTFTGAATYLKGTFNGTVQGGCAVYD